jgi:hypothetical protein
MTTLIRSSIRRLVRFIVIGTLTSQLLASAQYQLALQPDRSVQVTAPDGSSAIFSPEIAILDSEKNPHLQTRWGSYKDKGLSSSDSGSIYHVLTWGAPAEAVKNVGHVADGYDPNDDRFYGADRSPDFFRAGRLTKIRASQAHSENGRITWTFPETQGVKLSAVLQVPADGSEPRLDFAAHVSRSGWFSFGYIGAPRQNPQTIDELWQPLIYTEKRFPEGPYLEASARLTIPGTFVRHDGITVGVIADPAEMPFQPMPTLMASRFGVSLRNQQGEAQPMLFAPILGGEGSRLKANDDVTFSHRLVVGRRSIDETQEHLARTLFGFRNVRHNILGSLNATFERIIDFGLSEYARFNSDLRGFAYDTDVPGSVKNVSSLHPYSLALVTDDRHIFDELARPQAEYFVSRERFLFSTDPTVRGQSVSARLNGLGAPLSEYATLHSLAKNRTPFFRDAAMSLFSKNRILNLESLLRGNFWANSLALYRATGDQKWLDRAKRDADAYLAARVYTPQTNFEDPDSRGLFFWTSFSNQWKELLELFDETGDRRYLEAARLGARNYTRYIWFVPAIPDENVTVNEGGFAPNYRTGPKFPRNPLPEESVPAWQVSEIGLTPESSGTSRGHRGILLANYAPWMLRIAALTGDDFLNDVARSAIIGRYTSFPGYHLNTARTTSYQKPDFAARPKDQLNAMTSIHYNHIWPHAALLLDYLVSDVYAKSSGAIMFPSRYAEGYGYLQQKIYGDRPGNVYEVDGLYLWMPRGVVQVEHQELNYVVARGENQVAIALTNQSRDTVHSRVSINPTLIKSIARRKPTATVWVDGKKQSTRPLASDHSLEIAVSGDGVSAIVIDGVAPQVSFQNQALADIPALPEQGSVCELGYRGVRAVAMRFGSGDLTSVYTYFPDLDREITAATVFYRQGNSAIAKIEDRAFPFDYTLPVSGDEPMEFWFEIELANGTKEKSPVGRVLFR